MNGAGVQLDLFSPDRLDLGEAREVLNAIATRRKRFAIIPVEMPMRENLWALCAACAVRSHLPDERCSPVPGRRNTLS
ncbi:MAG: hypothetical protein GXP48_12390 [Acidobacteria bacterium]|nr:hypothetical protein [Acidobacteriota bacterium]